MDVLKKQNELKKGPWCTANGATLVIFDESCMIIELMKL